MFATWCSGAIVSKFSPYKSCPSRVIPGVNAENKGKPCLALNLSRHDVSNIRECAIRDDGAKFGNGGGGKKCRCSSVGRAVDADFSCLESPAKKEIDRPPNVPPLEPTEPDAVAPGASASSQVKDEHVEAGLDVRSCDVGMSAAPAIGVDAVNKHNSSIP